MLVIIHGANAGHNFVSWFVTARGNTIPLEKEQAIIVAQVSPRNSSMAVNFKINLENPMVKMLKARASANAKPNCHYG